MAVRRWQLPGRSGHPLSVATPCVAPWPQPRGAFRLLADGSVRYRHAPRGDWRCGAELRAAAAKPAWVAHGCGSRVCPRCITFTERGAYRTAAQASDIWQGRVFRSHSVCTALRRRLLQASAAHAALGTPGLACPGVASAGRHGHQPCIALAGALQAVPSFKGSSTYACMAQCFEQSCWRRPSAGPGQEQGFAPA